jgi:hypothetical protein
VRGNVRAHRGVYANHMTGTIPTETGNLVALRYTCVPAQFGLEVA